VLLLVGFALAMLARPGEVLAKQGPHSVGRGESEQLAMQTPRRSMLAVGDAQSADDDASKVTATVADPGVVIPGGAIEHDTFVGEDVGGGERRRLVDRLRARGPPVR
jgi:hypothetical protein